MNAVAKHLKTLRRERQLTQEALAELLHVTRQTVSSWETGKTQPDIETLTALAATLGTDVNGLIYGPRPAEIPYPNNRRGRIVFALVCAVLVAIWAVLELTLVPHLKALQTRRYEVWPGLIYRSTVRPLAGLALAGFGLGTLSIWKDIRVKRRAVRLAFRTAGIVLLAAVGALVLLRICGVRSYALLVADIWLVKNLLWVFAGIGGCLYLGWNR